MSLVRACLYVLMSNVEISAVNDTLNLTQKDYLFRSFIELLTNLDVKPRNVQWYADRLNVTSKYLSAVCKKVSGRTAFQWINDSVQKDIVYWLQSSDRSIKEIVHLLQFPNNSFFCKYCRQHFGMSPTAYIFGSIARNKEWVESSITISYESFPRCGFPFVWVGRRFPQGNPSSAGK